MIWPPALLEQARTVVAHYTSRAFTLAVAESCTGGLISALITEIPGSSAVLERGFVTYSNAAKAELLGADPAVIERCGAVSSEVAHAMALGALKNAQTEYALSVTGIAGPDGGSEDKPVGLVWFGVATRHGVLTHKEIFEARSRHEIRLAAVKKALNLLQV